MFNRTKSYLLLTMLVLTGFAGRIHSDTLTGKERRQLIKELKQSRASIAETIEGLSDKQFNHVSRNHGRSVRDCIYSLTAIENQLWNHTRSVMLEPSSAPGKENRLDRLRIVANMLSVDHSGLQHAAAFTDINTALEQFRYDRHAIIRYAKTTTDDLHKYKLKTNAGDIDVYQLILLHTRYTEACSQLIADIKRSPDFPK